MDHPFPFDQIQNTGCWSSVSFPIRFHTHQEPVSVWLSNTSRVSLSNVLFAFLMNWQEYQRRLQTTNESMFQGQANFILNIRKETYVTQPTTYVLSLSVSYYDEKHSRFVKFMLEIPEHSDQNLLKAVDTFTTQIRERVIEYLCYPSPAHSEENIAKLFEQSSFTDEHIPSLIKYLTKRLYHQPA